MRVYLKFKKIMDILFSLISLLLLWPIFILIAILIKLDSKGTVFFRQKRIGKNKKKFYILKFRTMRTNTPNEMPSHMLSDPEKYITKIGKFLRKTSLDELPQILNILKGEMSFIGPRPALWNQYDLIDERDKYSVNDIYPGLTGWAQINGRDELPIDVKANLDGEYVNRMSFFFDLLILFKTVFNVLGSKGVIEGAKDDKSIDL